MPHPFSLRHIAAALLAVAALPGPAAPQSLQRQLKEANDAFTFNSEPINPRVVQDLMTWLSDGGPGPVAVDVESTRSNRYFGEFKRGSEGDVTVDLATTMVPRSTENKGYFSYKRLGTLTNGMHVLETWENGGGSGAFTSLLLVRFLVDFEYDDKGARRERLVMMRTGEIGLGDRYAGAVNVKGNAVQIGASEGFIAKSPARTITFR